jgi:hypothetical protein
LDDIEAGMVVCETPELAALAYSSFRELYPTMPLVILDGSPAGSDCPRLMAALLACDTQARLVVAGKNVGHGPGMHRILRGTRSRASLLFDSDVEFLRSGFAEAMSELLTDRTVAVGQLLQLDRQWLQSVGLPKVRAPLPYVHPALHLVNLEVYRRLAPYGQHGAPCLWTAMDARRLRYEGRDFPVWDYALHKGRGTRDELKRLHLPVSYRTATAQDGLKKKRRKR